MRGLTLTKGEQAGMQALNTGRWQEGDWKGMLWGIAMRIEDDARPPAVADLLHPIPSNLYSGTAQSPIQRTFPVPSTAWWNFWSAVHSSQPRLSASAR